MQTEITINKPLGNTNYINKGVHEVLKKGSNYTPNTC